MRAVSIAGACACAGLLLVLAGNARSEALSGGSRTEAPAPTRIAGVTWETSVARAMERARREGKPILLLQLFGRLDEEFC